MYQNHPYDVISTTNIIITSEMKETNLEVAPDDRHGSVLLLWVKFLDFFEVYRQFQY